MAERIGWDKFETALLIEACERVANGYPKQEMVKSLSTKLRIRAISQGQEIDELFRNENGIALQMNKMDYLLTDGKRGLPGASKFFAEMVELKRNIPGEFLSILKSAKQQISEERNGNAEMSNKRTAFIAWINTQGKLKVHPNGVVSVLDESSEYAQKHGVSKISFWEMDNSAVFVSTYRKLSANKLFRVFKRNTALMLDKVFGYYRDFLDSCRVIETQSNNATVEESSEIGGADSSDASVRANNPELYDKVYAALERLSKEKNWGVSVLAIYEVSGGSLPEIKNILDQVTWANADGKQYRFAGDIEETIGTPAKIESSVVEVSVQENTVIDEDELEIPINSLDTGFVEWLINKGMAEATVRSYSSSIKSAQTYAEENGIQGVFLTSNNASQVLESIDILLANKSFIEHNQKQHNRFSAAFRKLRDYISEIDRRESQRTSDTELEVRNPVLYHKLYSVSKVFDDPQGLTVDHILTMVGVICSKGELIEFLDRISWATKLSNELYTFATNISPAVVQPVVEEKEEDLEPGDFDKDSFIRVLMSRYQSGMQFDSIDLENFRDTYEDMYDEKLTFSDEELEARLKYCGILYKDRLFPAEGIIDNGTKERLFAYIENKFAAGNKVLYYKAIFSDLADAFAYCFSLTDEQMLKAYIEHTAEKGKYYFHSNFMSTEKNVKIDHSAEIEDFMLAAGKPLSYEEVYEGLSHISKDIIYREIRIGSKFLMNEKEHYYHIDIFEFSETDGDKIAEILNKEIDENGYAIWSKVFDSVKEQMPIFIENNLYLSPLGIRNALSRFMAERFDLDGEVISTYGAHLGMADVFRLYAKHNAPFSDTDLYNFSKATDTTIYFWALAEESVRVSKTLFVAKDQIEFDVEATDKALETYLSSGYILVKDVDSFLVFPNVGYEWNEFLLESYLLHYSKKFCLVNNGISLNNVAGAVAKKDGKFTQFVDICAQALADSGIDLKKTVALNYLADINLITRRSYKELDVAMTKARQIRNRKG